MMEQYILKEQTRHGTSLFPLACYRMEQAENFTVPLHWHEETEILFLEQGSFHYSCNMQEQVIAAPAFVVFPSGSIHSLTASQNPSANSLVFRLDMLQFCGCDHIQSGLLEPLLEAGSAFLPCFCRIIPVTVNSAAFTGTLSSVQKKVLSLPISLLKPASWKY